MWIGELSGDAVAALLVSQSVQNLVVEMKTEFSQTLAELKEATGCCEEEVPLSLNHTDSPLFIKMSIYIYIYTRIHQKHKVFLSLFIGAVDSLQ